MAKKSNIEKTDMEFLDRLVGWRNEAQLILFSLLELVTSKRSKLKNDPNHNAIFQLLVGAAFSLWRASILRPNNHLLKKDWFPV
jgi:hypothetical protein